MDMNANDTLYVIADGESASLYTKYKSDKDGPKLKHVESRTPENLADDGPSGKQPPESSEQDLDEAVFTKQLGQYLNKRKYESSFGSLVLVADPTTLGQLRGVLNPQTRDCIIEEHAKTLTTATLDHIHRSLF